MKNKKIILTVMSTLILYNFGISAFANSDLYEGDLSNVNESIPIVYETSNYYNTRSTLALGSLGLSTSGGTAILGGLASVVGPLLGAIALVGGAIVVGQGLVNIYDYLREYALTKSEAEALGTSVSVESDGKVKLTLVPKTGSGGSSQPEKPKLNDPKYKMVGFSLLSFIQSKKNDDTTSTTINNYLTYDTSQFKLYNSSFKTNYTAAYFKNTSGWFMGKLADGNYYITNHLYVALSHDGISRSYVWPDSTYSGYIYDVTTGTVKFSSTFPNTDPYNKLTTKKNLSEVLNDFGVFILTNEQFNAMKSSSDEATFQHPQYEFIIDKNVIEKLNPDVTFDSVEGIYKNPIGDSVIPGDLIVPMPDTLTDTNISYSPDVESVIKPEGDIVPDTDTGTDSNTWFDKFWNWVNSYWEKFVELMMFLFVPSCGFMDKTFSDIGDMFNSKFPIFNQFFSFLGKFGYNYEPSPPDIKITFPDIFGGETYTFVDFVFFEKYRPYLFNIVRLFIYINFIKSVYRRLPNIISGGGNF